MQGFIAFTATDSRVSSQAPVCMLPRMRIGERIKYARTKHRLEKGLDIWTQDQLADAAGMERGKLSLIEIGKTKNVSEGDAKALATALRVSPCWLALEVGPVEANQSGESAVLDDALLQCIIEVVLEVVIRRRLSTSPERISRFITRMYKEKAGRGPDVDREEIEKILSYID